MSARPILNQSGGSIDQQMHLRTSVAGYQMLY